MELIISIVGWACIGVLFVSAEPLIRFKHFVFKRIKDYETKWYWRLLNCASCSSFWISLIATGSILTAAIIAVLSEVLYQKINGGL